MVFLGDWFFFPFEPFWQCVSFLPFRHFWLFELLWPFKDHSSLFDHLSLFKSFDFLYTFGPWKFGFFYHLDLFDLSSLFVNYAFHCHINGLSTIAADYWHQTFSLNDVVYSTCLYGCSYIDSWQGQGVCLALQHALRKIGYLGDF